MLPMGVAPEVASKRSLLLAVSFFLTTCSPDLQPVFQHCKRLVIDAERWRRSHDSAQDALTAMDGVVSFSCCLI